MTYRIEINADTLSELAGKVLALAAQLNTGTATEAVAEAPKPKKVKKTEEVGNEPAPVAEEPAPSTTADTNTDAPVASASEPLDFDKDVAPAVLALVAAKGKPAVQEILSEYGVERASQVDDALWPELVATLRAAV